jgi:hypothetical protein
MTQAFKNMLFCNVKYHNAPNEYILHQSKHIPRGVAALENKFAQIKAFAEKNHGEARIVKDAHIKKSSCQIIVWMCCACTANKKFDEAIGEA